MNLKNFQQNLLVAVALALCGLCVYQWYGQTRQRNAIQILERRVYDQAAAIQGYTNSIRNMDRQIAQMDAGLTELKAEGETNADLVVSQRHEIARLQLLATGWTNEIAQYQAAVTNLQGKLKEAYDGIQKQNAAMKEVVAQRDEFVSKYNAEVKDRNDVVNKYNDLVRQVQTNQAGGSRQ